MAGIDTAYVLGDDQMKCHYNLIFPNGFPFSQGDGVTQLVIRAKTFEVPGEEKGVYTRSYHGLDFEKTGGHTETKHFTFTFDVPKSWSCYNQLKQWLDASCDPETGARLPDDSLRVDVIVQPIDIEEGGAEVPTRNAIRFRKCKIIKLDGISFSHSEKDSPLEANVEMLYLSKSDRGYL